MRIVLLGAPGSGKGTQAKLLARRFNIPQISTGDLLRAAVIADTRLGRLAKAAMDSGQLVSDDVVLAMIRERLAKADAQNGFIFDGFPRNIPQAQALNTMLIRIHQPLQLALLIDVELDILIQRLTGRRTCESCGQMFNIYTSPSRFEDRCDRCGGHLRHRADDNEETIGNRLRVYEAQTVPLINYYREQAILRTIQGIGEVEDVSSAIIRLVMDVASQASEKKRPQAPEKARPAVIIETAVKKAAPKKKAAARKKAAVKKAAPKKKAAARKKAAVKKAAPKKKVAARKKAAVKKAAPKKKAAARKKAAVKKAAPKKKVAARKKAAVKKAAPKKKAAARKKAAVKKAAPGKKNVKRRR